MTNTAITAASLLVGIRSIAQVDLIGETLESYGPEAAALEARIAKARELGYWRATEDGLVELTPKGQRLVADAQGH